MKNETDAPFVEHLREFRLCLIKSLTAVGLMTAVVYNFSGKILAVLAKPAGQLVFIYPAEAFVTHIKIALWGGWFAASPVVIYQIWQFVAAGLIDKEKRFLLKIFPVSLFMFASGAAFGFFIVSSMGIQFLLSFGNGVVVPMISISSYVSFIARLSFAFGFVFQLPLILTVLTQMGLVSPQLLTGKRRYAVVAIFATAAVLTPGPDIISQFSMAIPLLFLYEIGIICSKFTYRRKHNQAVSPSIA